MNKTVVIVGVAVFAMTVAVGAVLYSREAQRNAVLRNENLKTAQEAQSEVNKANETLRKEREKYLDDKQKLVGQMNAAIKEQDRAVKELGELKKKFYEERTLSVAVNDDINKLRNEVLKLRKDNSAVSKNLNSAFKKKQQAYDARILSLESQLEKARTRLNTEAGRYHYNLGVLYTQNKDFEAAINEYKLALGYTPKDTRTHYNLGIIYDDYFKDKDNAKYYYRQYLELCPTCDDAEAVREWLAALEK